MNASEKDGVTLHVVDGPSGRTTEQLGQVGGSPVQRVGEGEVLARPLLRHGFIMAERVDRDGHGASGLPERDHASVRTQLKNGAHTGKGVPRVGVDVDVAVLRDRKTGPADEDVALSEGGVEW